MFLRVATEASPLLLRETHAAVRFMTEMLSVRKRRAKQQTISELKISWQVHAFPEISFEAANNDKLQSL